MLVIRLQRTGRSGHAQFRIVVQDSRFSPSKGRVVAFLGSYNPHSKEITIDGEKVSQYLANGAQPSDRVAKLLQSEGIKLPGWVKVSEPGKRTTRNPDKRRSTRPAAPEAEAPAEEPAAEEAPQDTPAETAVEAAEPAAENAPAEPAAEAEEVEPEPAAENAPAPEAEEA